MNKLTEDILLKYCWEVECEDPLEIRHEDGSFATGIAAELVIEECKKAFGRFKRECKKIAASEK